MLYKVFKIVVLTIFSLCIQEVAHCATKVEQSFYLGALSGYGTTTWDGLVPSANNRNAALDMSLPIDAKEGGYTWGFFSGMRISQHFFVEASYKHFPKALVRFDPDSIFAMTNDNQTELSTDTDEVSLLGKLIVEVPNTALQVFSGVGLSWVHRKDMLYRDARYTPTFSLGTQYQLSKKMFLQIDADYTIGYGESQLNPADAYVPFLFAILAKIAYYVPY